MRRQNLVAKAGRKFKVQVQSNHQFKPQSSGITEFSRAEFQLYSGKPRRKSKTDRGNIHLTRELFSLDEQGRLFIGSKTNNIGALAFKKHRKHGVPNSIYIRKQAGCYYVSFCFDDGDDTAPITDKEHLEHLKGSHREWLQERVIGVDRGVAIAVHGGQ